MGRERERIGSSGVVVVVLCWISGRTNRYFYAQNSWKTTIINGVPWKKRRNYLEISFHLFLSNNDKKEVRDEKIETVGRE